MPVQAATTSAMSSGETSSLSSRSPPCASSARLLVLELACELRQAPVAQLGGALQVAVALRALGLLAGLLDLRLGVLDGGDAGLLGLPALGQHGQLGTHALELAGERVATLLGGSVGLARERGVLDLELLRPALQHVELVRHRVDLDAQPARGLVDQVDRLVGQEAVGDVALGERAPRRSARRP